MTDIYREQPRSGRVLGIGVTNNGRRLNIRARKAVIVGTGGHTGNVNFRRMFDPRLTEEYCGLAGMPWSDQDGSGELAGMAIGASLWGLNIQANETGSGLTKAGKIGCQYGYVNLTWMPGSRVFDKAGASGLRVGDWQNVIMVNMIGKRFYDETGADFPGNQYNQIKNYVPHSYRNSKNVKWAPDNFINAAMAGIPGDPHNGGGPIWAIFDADAVAREKWDTQHPWVDTKNGFFFSADTLEELAGEDQNEIPAHADAAGRLSKRRSRATTRFVDTGVDADFDKPKPMYKIAEGAVLRRLGDARDSRHAVGLAHQCELPGHGHERAGDRPPLLRRRIGRRVLDARPRAVPHSGLHRGAQGACRKGDLIGRALGTVRLGRTNAS